MNSPSPVLIRLAVVFALAVWVAGCVSPPTIPGASPELLAFLRDGTTTREQAVLKLGQPSSTLVQETILTYRIGEDAKQGLFVVGSFANAVWRWDDVRYSLVLVFDDDGVLRRHSLVSVK